MNKGACWGANTARFTSRSITLTCRGIQYLIRRIESNICLLFYSKKNLLGLLGDMQLQFSSIYIHISYDSSLVLVESLELVLCHRKKLRLSKINFIWNGSAKICLLTGLNVTDSSVTGKHWNWRSWQQPPHRWTATHCGNEIALLLVTLTGTHSIRGSQPPLVGSIVETESKKIKVDIKSIAKE